MQDGIKEQDGKISKTNKHAGWNEGMQVGLFLFSLVKIEDFSYFSSTKTMDIRPNSSFDTTTTAKILNRTLPKFFFC